jgi:hypothetical protein
MTRAILVTNLLIVAVLASGCATIVTGKYQNVSVTSEPPGAKVIADNGMSITTPGSLKLVRNRNCKLVAEYPGAESQQKELKHTLQGWFWGNILLVSCAGCAADLASGSAYKLIPDKVHFDFTSTGIAAVTQIPVAGLNKLSAKDVTKEKLQASLDPAGFKNR